MALQARQKLFVEEYLKDLNATRAAERAGYKHPLQQGPRLLGNVGVAQAIQAAQAERARKAKIDATWVLEKLIENRARAAQATPVLDREGNPTGEYRYEGSVVNKALELIGKHLGMYRDVVEHQGQQRIIVVEEEIMDGHGVQDPPAPGANGVPKEQGSLPGIRGG